MTNLKLKDSNNNVKLTLTPNSLAIDDLFLSYSKYFRRYPEEGISVILFDNLIKKRYRRKLKRNKQYFKPKNETINIVSFVFNRGVLKINEIL